MREFVVPDGAMGERLDRWLARAQPELSRARLQGLIRDGRVRVNGTAARTATRLRAGDRVQLDPLPASAVRLEPEAIPLAIVHSDDALLVVDKPAGLVVHPGAGVTRGTLVHALLHADPAIAGVGGEGRPGIVHRLDRDTSGLMIVARTERAYRALVAAIGERRVRRTYRALVWGNPRADRGTVEEAIGRDPRHRQRMAVVRRGGRAARTHWRVLRRFEVASELELVLDTGRTHQIRVHLAHLGHPVIGDPVYGGRTKKLLSLGERQRSLAGALLKLLSRQALHASELALEHPVTGTRLRFSSPPPDDYQEALRRLESEPAPGRS